MKKLFFILFSIIFALNAVACGTEPTNTTQTTPTTPTTGTSTTATTENGAGEAGDPIMRPAQEIKIVDFNLLAEEETVATRKTEMISTMLSYDADSIGVQEARGSWVSALRVGLGSKYGRVGIDAGGNTEATSTHFATYIFYRKDRYRVVASETLWLTNTPDEPSKYNENTTANRTCTWALLEDLQTGFRYVHMNSHLDWQDDSANAVQCIMIRNLMLRFEEMGYPVFATGDYNTSQGSPSYLQITTSERLDDANLISKLSVDTSDTATKKPIDFCFVTSQKMEILRYEVINNLQNGVTISDHKGLYVHASVQSLPDQSGNAEIPAFDAGVEAEIRDYRGEMICIELPQAKTATGSVPMRYQVTLTGADGTRITTKNVSAGFWLTEQPETLRFFVDVPRDNTVHHLFITPVGFLCENGKAITVDLPARGGVVAEAVEAAAFIDLRVINGKAVDCSANGYGVVQSGTVGFSGGQMTFTKNGCLKVEGVRNHYLTMQKGFSIELDITTGSDISSAQSYCSNLHAGGYGVQINGGKLQFVVHHGGEYVYVGAYVSTNTTYHVVAVYDTETISIYLNGSLAAICKLAPGVMGLPTDRASEHLCLGADSEPGGVGQSHAACNLKLVRIYDVALSDANARALYEQSR